MVIIGVVSLGAASISVVDLGLLGIGVTLGLDLEFVPREVGSFMVLHHLFDLGWDGGVIPGGVLDPVVVGLDLFWVGIALGFDFKLVGHGWEGCVMVPGDVLGLVSPAGLDDGFLAIGGLDPVDRGVLALADPVIGDHGILILAEPVIGDHGLLALGGLVIADHGLLALVDVFGALDPAGHLVVGAILSLVISGFDLLAIGYLDPVDLDGLNPIDCGVVHLPGLLIVGDLLHVVDCAGLLTIGDGVVG